MSSSQLDYVGGHPIDDFRSTEIVDVDTLAWSGVGLVVILNAPHQISVEFDYDSVLGFRVLDEGDLPEFWGNPSLRKGWLFEVTKGGWFDLEASRAGFLSADRDIKEYLIATQFDCVSVLAFRPPAVKHHAPGAAGE